MDLSAANIGGGQFQFTVKGVGEGRADVTLRANYNGNECSTTKIIKVELIEPTDNEMVNSKTETKEISYATNPPGTITYINLSTADPEVGTIVNNNRFKPGGDEDVFSNAGAGARSATTNITGKIRSSLGNQYVDFSINNPFKVKNAPPTIAFERCTPPGSPAYNGSGIDVEGIVIINDIDNTNESFAVTTMGVEHDGPAGQNAPINKIKTFTDAGTLQDGTHEIRLSVKIKVDDASPIYQHKKSLNISVGAGVEAGVVVAGVTFSAQASGNIHVNVPTSRGGDAVGLFLHVCHFPSGIGKSKSIKDWVDNTLAILFTKNKITFDVNATITDGSGGEVKVVVDSVLDFESTEATGQEDPEINAFAQ